MTDCRSRYLLACEGLESTKAKGAFPVFERAFKELGLPAAIRTDNGAPFASAHALFGLSRLSVWWLRLGVAGARKARLFGEQGPRPATRTQCTLVVMAMLEHVRVLAGKTPIASHPCSFDRDQQIEDPEHLAGLVADKRRGREHRAKDRLQHAATSAPALFQAAAARHHHLGVLTRGLIELLDAHGAAALEEAVAEALVRDTPHLAGVRHLIDQQRHARGLPPPLPLALPDDPRLRTLHVRPHDLADYDDLQGGAPPEENDHGRDDT